MKTTRITLAVAALVILAVVATVQAGAAPSNVRWTADLAAAPAMPAVAVPEASCALNGTTRTCDLWATTGTVTLPDGATVNIWGFAAESGVAAQLPGPTVVAFAGETLELVLHNRLVPDIGLPGETVALAFPGLEGWVPDLDGVAPGSDKTYTISLAGPGSYLYEAGMTANGAKQVAMGMVGGLIVRPATTVCTSCAYDVASAYDLETLLILSEIDPAFNAAPATFSLENFAPKYWLINGKSHPDTGVVDVAAGNRVLLRYLNAGIKHHAMGLLGLQQTVIAADGVPFAHTRRAVAEIVWPGQSIDALVAVPAGLPAGTKFALYDTSLSLHSNGARPAAGVPTAFGGMLSFLNVASAGDPLDPGPGVTATAFNPTRTSGPLPAPGGAVFTATLDETNTGGDNVDAVEYFVDVLGAPGTGTAVAGYTPGIVVNVSVTFDAATLAAWTSGPHTVYVRGKDHSTWGPAGSAVLNLDKTGPEIKGVSLAPNPANGSVNVAVQATADETNTGAGTVASATFSIDGGAAQPLTLSKTNALIASLTAAIPAATVAGLPEGPHAVSITGVDDLGSVTLQPATISLVVDKTGPAPNTVTVTPSTLNYTGQLPLTVRLEGSVIDALGTVATVEGFIDQLGQTGTGFAMYPLDGLYDEASETAYYAIPIGNFNNLAQGPHPLYVRGKDKTGNWGAAGSATLTIDRGVANDTVGPNVTGLLVSPNPASNTQTVTLTATATDANRVSTIDRAEWFRGTDPGAGNGTAMMAKDGAFNSTVEALTASITLNSTWRGRVPIYVRAMDAKGNWGPVSSITLRIR